MFRALLRSSFAAILLYCSKGYAQLEFLDFTDLFTIVLTNPAPGKVPQTPSFSGNPTAMEIMRARIFEEPLVPVWGLPSDAENKALAQALTTFANRSRADDFSALEDFLDSPVSFYWYSSLLSCLGNEYYRTGYYSSAISAWEEAWLWLDGAPGKEARLLADKTVGELARMHSRIGNFERLKSLFEELGGRPLSGPATETIAGARQALWMMQNRPDISFRCGPLALRAMAKLLGSRANLDDVLCRSTSTQNGVSLAQLKQLAAEMEIDVQVVKRPALGEIVVPSVVHWKVGHFAAITRHEGNRYLVVDPTFGNSMWVGGDALEAESSGYFIVPTSQSPAKWPTVSDEESRGIFGKGVTSSSNPNNTTLNDQMANPNCGSGGMAVDNIHLFLVSLHIEDTPLAFTPPRGLPIGFTAVYNQREANQPAIFTYANLGPKWTCDWISYIKDSGTNPPADVEHYVRGGGTEVFGYDGTNYQVEWRSQCQLVRASSTSYEMTMPDGSKQIYSQPDGTVGNSRKVFLTHVVDATGYTNILNYDPSLRLVSVTDPVAGVTNLTFFYNDNPFGGPLNVIRMVTDRYGRSATIGYEDPSDGLETIGDTINLTSKVFYAESFINKLQTPYGVTTFDYGEESNTRWLETTDALGNKARAEYNQSLDTGIRSSDPGTIVPIGMYTRNYVLNGRNTFYWDKRAMREAPGDYSKARIYHWLHGLNGASAEGVLESYKEPLENRVWFNYPGQSASSDAASYQPQLPGAVSLPSRIGRVLGDDYAGQTQLYQFYRNALGYITNSIDPIGRNFTFVYAANLIDLMEVRQTRGTNNELLASFTYNSQHLPLTSQDAAGQTYHFAYNAYGQLTGITNPLSQVTVFNYDGSGRLSSIDGPLAGTSDTISFGYDAYDRVKAVTNVDGYFTTFTYDAFDRVTTNIYPDGTFESFTYNRLDPETATDRAGRITQFVFNPLRQLEEIREATNWVTRFDWCRCGDLEGILDPLGQVTRWLYDIQGRVTTKRFADGSSIEYGYEPATSRVRTVKNERDQVRTNFYDYDDNLLAVVYANSSVTPTVTFTSDTNYNRLLSVSDGIGTTTFDYFPITLSPTIGAGRLKSINGPFSDDTLEYFYDELGRVKTERIYNAVLDAQFPPDGWFSSFKGYFYSNSWTYDALGRVSQAANRLIPYLDSASGTFTFSYAGASTRLASIDYPNDQTTIFSYYDLADDFRLKSIVNTNPGVLLSRFDYTYDKVGRITNWTKETGGSGAKTNDLSYDELGQLTNVSVRATGNTNTFAYTYDLAGNRTAERIGTNLVRAWFNPLNEIVGKDTGSSVARSYEWDEENRLHAIVEGTKRTVFYYNALGRCGAIQEFTGTNLTLTRAFTWSGDQMCEARDSDGSYAYYKWYYNQGCHDIANLWPFYFTKDHLGSIWEVTRGYDGELVHRYGYDPHGRQTNTDYVGFASEPHPGPGLGLSGLFTLEPQNLLMAEHRVYDPDLGRWMSRDPIEEAGGLNLYRYANNDPINFVDPDGLCPAPKSPMSSAGSGAGARPPRPPRVASAAGAGGESGGWGPQRVNAAKTPTPFESMLGKVGKLDFSTPANKAIFYSGKGQGDRAAAFAERTGGMTIEMTAGGRALAADPLFQSLSPAQQFQIWQRASVPFAKGASGRINAFIRGARPDRTFREIEEPILNVNPNVYRSIYHY